MLLSVIIPSRNEMFLKNTIDDILAHRGEDTEVIAICDGQWPVEPIPDHPRVTLVYHSKSIGQRAATNEGVRLSTAKFIMKADAHCSFASGFDKQLTDDCKYHQTMVPRMYNLHAFDWVCDNGHRRYQGPSGVCKECGKPTKMDMVWKPRLSRRSDFMRFDKDMHFQYWGAFEKRPEGKPDIAPQMCCVGACWMMHRDRYWELGGLDESHGSWGQMGVEIACKSWLSGGEQVVNKKTWFAHMFRTQGGDFGFPYPLRGKEVDKARKRSKELFQGKVKPILDKFYPVPSWHDDTKTDMKIEVPSGEK